MPHPKRLPEIAPLLERLAAHGVRYVLVGSVAAQLYGAALTPGDLDITPVLDAANLGHLAALLVEIEATPGNPPGAWQVLPDGERRWIAHHPTASAPTAASAWHPDPAEIATLDHLFCSRYGNFDIVPDLSGTYETLMLRAVRLEAYGQRLSVAHIDDLLAALTVARRAKDAPRVQQLRALQQLRGASIGPS